MGAKSPEEFYHYDTVIPAEILFNRDLSDRAKILYGLLRNMANFQGYAFPKNERLQEFFGGVSEDTISRLLRSLEKAGAISIENGTGGRTLRKIYVGEVYAANLRKNAEVNPRIFAEVTNNSNKNKKREGKPSDAAAEWLDHWAVSYGWAHEDDCQPEAQQRLIGDLHSFLENRAAKKKPMLTVRAASMLVNRLVSYSDGYQPKIPAMRYILQEAVSHNWEKVFPVKNEDDFADFLVREGYRRTAAAETSEGGWEE